MSNLFKPRQVVAVIALTLVWCGLWHDLSAANLLSGFVLAVLVTASGVGTPNRGGIRLVPLLQLTWVVFVDLVRSTASVIAEVATPGDNTSEAIVAVESGTKCRDHLLLLVIAITLTPGTAVVATDPDTGTLYLHLLHHQRRDESVAHVERLVELAAAALPTNPEGVLV